MLARLLTREAVPVTPSTRTATVVPYPSLTSLLTPVNESRVRGLPPMTAGINLIGGTLMQMPLMALRITTAPGVADVVIETPAVLRHPTVGANRTVADFVTEYTYDSVLFGNYVALLGAPDSTGYPTALVPVPVTSVEYAVSDEGRITYRWDGNEYDESNVFHIAHECRTGEVAGVGVIRRYRDALQGVIAAETHTSAYFGAGALPPGILYDSRPDLTQEQANALKGKWPEMLATRQPMVLPKTTTEFVPLVTDADKAQLVEARKWNAQLVAMMLGIPPYLLGIESPSMTYSNAETEKLRFIETTIMRYAVPLEQQFSRQCLPSTQYARFDTRFLLRSDTSTRYANYATGLASGFLTVNEVRALEGRPPLDNPQPVPQGAPA